MMPPVLPKSLPSFIPAGEKKTEEFNSPTFSPSVLHCKLPLFPQSTK